MARLSLMVVAVAAILFGGCARQNTGVRQPDQDEVVVTAALVTAGWVVDQARGDLRMLGYVSPANVQQALRDAAASIQAVPATPANNHALQALDLIEQACRYTATTNFDQTVFWKKIGYAQIHMDLARQELKARHNT